MENKAPSSYPLKPWAAVGPPSKVPSAHSSGVPTRPPSSLHGPPGPADTWGGRGKAWAWEQAASDPHTGFRPPGTLTPAHPSPSLRSLWTPRPAHRPAVNTMAEKTLRHRLATVVATAAATISVCRGSPSLESGQGADFSTHRASVCPPHLAKTLQGQGLGSGRGAGNLPPLLVRVGRLCLNF